VSTEQEPDPGIPEWVVTFGDMMSLLLTFFIMLVSMSEMKQEEKFQAMVESMHQQFGHDRTLASLIPGNIRPRNSALEHVASMGRAKKKDTANGGQKKKSVSGEHEQVQIVRPGNDSSNGGVVYFDEGAAELTEENKRDLQQIIRQIAGKPQKIEIRGHTSRRPIQPNSGLRDHWDLAYARCRNTMKFLIGQGIDPARIRLGPAATGEPLYNGVDSDRLKRNSRVQILMWDERVQDLEGAEDPRSIMEGV
jgi:chemotaxis protein MotB